MDDNPTSTLMEVHAPFPLHCKRWKTSSERVPLGLTVHRFSVWHQQKLHRLDLGPVLTGIALSSVRMHKYSPITAINAMQATLTSHQDRTAGRWALYIQQPIIWKKCTVTVKSRHCFPRRMKNHRPRALQEEWDRKVMSSADLCFRKDLCVYKDAKFKCSSFATYQIYITFLFIFTFMNKYFFPTVFSLYCGQGYVRCL